MNSAEWAGPDWTLCSSNDEMGDRDQAGGKPPAQTQGAPPDEPGQPPAMSFYRRDDWTSGPKYAAPSHPTFDFKMHPLPKATGN